MKEAECFLDTYELSFENETLRELMDQIVICNKVLESKKRMIDLSQVLISLKKLKDMDISDYSDECKSLRFYVGGLFGGFKNYYLEFEDNRATFSHSKSNDEKNSKIISFETIQSLRKEIGLLNLNYWDHDYDNYFVCDGCQWGVTIIYTDGRKVTSQGSNAYPKEWERLNGIFRQLAEV